MPSAPHSRWCRWTSNSASIKPYIPCRGPNSSSKSNCTTDQTTCSPLSNNTWQGAIRGNMALETFCWHVPVLVLLGLPLHHAEMTSSGTQRRAVSCNVALETLCWHAPILVLLRLPLFHTEVTLFHWISLRGCVAIPVCRFHSFVVLTFLLPLSESLWDLSSDLVPF